MHFGDIFSSTATREDLEKVLENFKEKFRKNFKDIDFAVDALALYYYISDNNIPFLKRSPAILALIYFINPMDIVPDILAGGFIDDAALIAGLIKYYRKNIEPYKKKARDWFNKGADFEYIDAEYEILN